MDNKISFTTLVISSGLLTLLVPGFFGSFGALVQYLYSVVKEDNSYSVRTLLDFCVMGFFVGLITHYSMEIFFSESYPGVVLISGFIFMKILDFLDGAGLVDLIRILVKK
jgi:H+/Cl- antiporter ClcA